jgi:hypothetical protein
MKSNLTEERILTFSSIFLIFKFLAKFFLYLSYTFGFHDASCSLKMILFWHDFLRKIQLSKNYTCGNGKNKPFRILRYAGHLSGEGV